MHKIAGKLESLNCTSIITAERLEVNGMTTRLNVENFVLNSVIVLRDVVVGNNLQRIMIIEKMRGIKNDSKIHKFEITDNVIVVR